MFYKYYKLTLYGGLCESSKLTKNHLSLDEHSLLIIPKNDPDFKIGVACMIENFRQLIVWFVFLSLFCTFVIDFGVEADRGMVSIEKVDIPLYEPGQRAIICWNGTEEILVLSTNVYAQEPTKVLEIMPLPSVPTIETCDVKVFETLKSLVEWESQQRKDSGGYDGKNVESSPPPEVEVIFYDKLGVHNITVIKAYTSSGFASWVNDFLNDSGLSPMSFPEAERIAASYMSRGINYFVLDILELTQELRTPEPLMYRFNSTSIYYPMEITTLTGGGSHILLFILTPFEIVNGPITETEVYDFEEITAKWQEETYIEVIRPNSPVNFRTITTSSVHTDVLHNRIYDYNDEPDVALAEIYDFFKSYGEIKIGVYVYEGPVDMVGDINITEYSVEKVIISEDTQYTSPDFCFSIWVPVATIIIIPFGCIAKLSQRVRRK